ncbi:ATP-binding protein [uncultured Chryseobacterium sp.]|uniref:tetratricopeptide repeat-containing sensor histidine kinase n=1 Tax=uncultured Chryseobacterium sp. TaxID=259322 RepID=UPI0025EA3DED|nr:ATP-binding protein [uncultured Chryseobacterium sp.]
MKSYYLFILIIIFSCSKKEITLKKELENSYYDKAFEYRDANNADSAFSYFNKAKDLFLHQNDSFGAGRCLVNMAIIQEKLGDNFGSLETGVSALKFINEKNPSTHDYLSINYNVLGLVSGKLRDFERAEEFNKKATFLANDISYKILYKNNLGIAYKEKKDYSKAMNVFEELLNDKEVNNDSITKAKIIDNLAYIKWLKNFSYNPVSQFQKALQIRIIKNDLWGQNASYAHLSDYYEKKKPDSALFFADKMYLISKKIDSPDDQLEALEKLIVLESSDISKNYFKIYYKLNDSLQNSRNKARNQFALIRYETEKNKANFLKSEADNSQKQNRILKLYFGLAILGICLIALFSINKRRQKQLKQEKELEVKNTQLKMSKKVHDVVANGIYQVMAKIENQEDFDRNKALDELEFVYEKSRDLSYEKAGEEKEFSQEMSELIAGFNNATVKTFTAGNDPSVWEKVSPAVKEEVYQMVRELMVNMKKHSQASHVAVKFEKTGETVEIQYKDNGVGISGDLIYKNGLRNTASRIEAIGGTITFDTKIEKGLKVNLSFPCS